MDLGLKGKIAVVTAASKGIGFAVTKMLVEEGAEVVAGARTVEALAGLAGVTALAVDLGSPDGPGRLVARAVEVHGRVDVLVNNMGGVRLRLNGFLGTSDEEFEWAMRMNFFSAVRHRVAIRRRCQRSRVAGVTMKNRQCARGSNRLAAAKNMRSTAVVDGRRGYAEEWRARVGGR